VRIDALRGEPDVERALADLASRPINFDVADMQRADPAQGWKVTDVCQVLEPEPPGPPLTGGSWEIARRLMRGYEFADPSIVRAYYDPHVPLRERTMLLKLQALGLVHLYAGVRVSSVYDDVRRIDGRDVHVWGWAYRTLQGHVEMGQMDWEVWKWVDTGTVEFRVHSVSRTAPVRNPVIRIGFRLVKGRERRAFLDSTRERMRTFVKVALEHEGDGASPVREAAARITARGSVAQDGAPEQLADQLRASE
jgi:uncharacterized protein (UPF0548 family)